MAEWPKGKRFPSVEIRPARGRAGFNSDLEPSCELPWNISLWVLEQLMNRGSSSSNPGKGSEREKALEGKTE